jgi:hypothetical protein
LERERSEPAPKRLVFPRKRGNSVVRLVQSVDLIEDDVAAFLRGSHGRVALGDQPVAALPDKTLHGERAGSHAD